ncbi:MAG: phospholipid carrier-dependent glycosyltransferase [Cyanobacteria bacterium P01_A01_bin.37]
MFGCEGLVCVFLKPVHNDIHKRFSKRFLDSRVDGVILVALWCLSVGLDRVWLARDHSVPSWDPADHLIGSLNYWWMVQNADLLSAEWWHGIWTLSSKYPPLLYLSTAPFINLFGSYADAAIWVNGLYTAILLIAVYGLGRLMFSPVVGLWAAGLSLLFPQFYVLRSQYFMDYPLAALVAAAFCVLTYWNTRQSTHQRWLSAIAFGVTFGLASLTKQTAVLFLGIPLLWLGLQSLWHRRWGQFFQLVLGSAIAGLMMLPWSRTNWLFQISAAFSANTRSAEIEGDPSGLSLEGWTYYLSHLPQAISYPLLITASFGLLLWGLGIFRPPLSASASPHPVTPNLRWLFMFIGGTYVVWSAIANKDVRYIMPYLPVIAVVLGVGMACWQGRWRFLPWATVGLSIALMLTNLFSPIGDRPSVIAKGLTPGGQHPVYRGEPWPHSEIMDEMIATQPYQLMNVGVLPSTPEINQHNLNYFGTQADFQVYARRMGKSKEHIEQDLRSLSWVVSVTRPQLNHHDRRSRQRQLGIMDDLRRSRHFKRQRTWELPDGSRLDLFRRRKLPIEVTPIQMEDRLSENSLTQANQPTIQLTQIKIPAQSAVGQPIPVTYTWEGSWDALSHGTVILTWQQQSTEPIQPYSQWFHDHNLGLGTLRPHPIQANQSVQAPAPETTASLFKVVERMAMQPPDDVAPGVYQLTASYLDTRTKEAVSLPVPNRVLTIEPSESLSALSSQLSVPDADEERAENDIDDAADNGTSGVPEVDWVSQLRSLSTALPQGIDALDPIFDQIGRFSLYDPIQSYARQAETTLTYRLQQDPSNVPNTYALTLAQVLQRDAEGAIATLNALTTLDADNPNPHAYLAFVNLYALHPRAAHDAINRAIALAPEVQEFKILRLAASLMSGDLWHAWREGRAVFAASSLNPDRSPS